MEKKMDKHVRVLAQLCGTARRFVSELDQSPNYYKPPQQRAALLDAIAAVEGIPGVAHEETKLFPSHNPMLGNR
jgi:hypothetical protein